jgi:protein O-GlcNAc transferase
MDFFKLYNDTLNNKMIHKNEELLIAEGIKLMKHVKDINTKEEIVQKLVELYPNRPDLYYYIGFEFKTINIDKAFDCFEKSYNINNSNIENVIELSICLVKKKHHGKLVKLMEENSNLNTFLEDYRFIILYVDTLDKISLYKQVYYLKKAVSIMNTNSKKNWGNIARCQCNLANVYEKLGQLDNAEKIYQQNLVEYESTQILKNSKQSYTDEEIHIHTNILSSCIYGSNLVYDTLANDIYYAYEAFMKKQSIKTIHKHNKKPRIGYISSDFINHAVSSFILPILQNHDIEKFDIYLFTNSPFTSNDLFINLEHTYFLITNMTSLEIVNLIKKNNIDILIDLNGITTGNSIDALTYKPCPVQMTYIGYLNTTGLSCIDYKITDYVCDVENTTQYYSEKLLHMNRCCYLYNGSYYQSIKINPKSTCDKIVLAAFNREEKMNKYVIESWKIILKKCPNTRLMILLNAEYDVEKRLDFYIKKLNVSKDRLVLIPYINSNLDSNNYYELYSKVDILLDTYPHSGMTTCCNALYNSIPVVTYSKPNIHLHNTATDILLHCGFPELVSYSEEEYINKVEELVNNPKKIDCYKKTIHDKFVKSMDPVPFMKDYEALLTSVYEKDILYKVDTNTPEVDNKNKLSELVSSYRLGDLVLLGLNESNKYKILTEHPDSIGSKYILKNNKPVDIDLITRLVLDHINKIIDFLPKDISESVVIHLRLGDVISGNEFHEKGKKPLDINFIKSLLENNDNKKYIIGKCFFSETSSKNYEECINMSNIYLQNVMKELGAEHFNSNNADIDLCCAVKAKLFVQGRGFFSKLIVEIRKRLKLHSIETIMDD